MDVGVKSILQRWNRKKLILCLIAVAATSASYSLALCEYGSSGRSTIKIYSNILKEERNLEVVLPDSYAQGARYPVLYVLDGEWHSYISSITQYMSSGLDGMNVQVPEFIVVFIHNTNVTDNHLSDVPTRSDIRFRDFTPTTSQSNSDHYPASGGADKFLRFLGEEAIPKIDSAFRTNRYRGIVGHSLSGLFALHTLITEPEMFDGYIAIDSSLWWDNQVILARLETMLRKIVEFKPRVYLALAEYKLPFESISNLKLLFGQDNSNRNFARLLDTAEASQPKSEFEYFADENHGSVVIPALVNGLKFLFNGYPEAVSNFFVQEKDPIASFKLYSESVGGDLIIPPRYFCGLMASQYAFVDEDNIGHAILLLQQSKSMYPTAAWPHYWLARYLLKSGDKVNAMQSAITAQSKLERSSSVLHKLIGEIDGT